MNQVMKSYSTPPTSLPTTATTTTATIKTLTTNNKTSVFKRDILFYHSAMNKKPFQPKQPQIPQDQQTKSSTLNSRLSNFLLSYRNRERDSLIIRLTQNNNASVVQQPSTTHHSEEHNTQHNTTQHSPQQHNKTASIKKSFLKRFKSYSSNSNNSKRVPKQDTPQPQVQQQQQKQEVQQNKNNFKLNLSRESLADANLAIITEDLIDLDAYDDQVNKKKRILLNDDYSYNDYDTIKTNRTHLKKSESTTLNDSQLLFNDTLSSISASMHNIDSKIMDICCCDLMISSSISSTTTKNHLHNNDDYNLDLHQHDSDSAICSAEKLSIHYDYSSTSTNNTNSNNNKKRTQTPTSLSCNYSSIDSTCSLQFHKTPHLHIDGLNICQIQKTKKYFLTKLNEHFLCHLKYSIKLTDQTFKPQHQQNQQAQHKFYSFRSFNTHTSVKEKRLKLSVPNASHLHFTSNSMIFGVGLSVHSYKTGGLLPLPILILKSMKIIEQNSYDLVGIFRKPGVKTRIDEIHKFFDLTSNLNLNKMNLLNFNDNFILNSLYDYDLENVNENNSYDNVKIDCGKINQIDFFDLADLIKQFFRELPECLLTNKFSQIFIAIYSAEFPESERFKAMQFAIMLMPDENREALHALLKFLHNIQTHKENNSMNASNLATCFVPSIFNLNIMKMALNTNILHNKENTILSTMFSPKRLRKSHQTHNQMMPAIDQKDMEEQRIAISCFTDMILKVKDLFELPEELIEQFNLRKDDSKQQILDLSIILNRNDDSYKIYVDKCYEEIIRESKDKAKGWVSRLYDSGIEIFNKNMNSILLDDAFDNDNYLPLDLYKCTLEMDAIKFKILQRILNEATWNKNIDEFDKIINFDEETDIVRYRLKSMVAYMDREALEFRSWKKDTQKSKYLFVSTSIQNLNFLNSHRYEHILQSNRIKANYYYNHYLIEYTSHNKMRITYFNRVDLKGKSLKWYTSVYSYSLLEQMKDLKSFLKKNMFNSKYEQNETIV